MTRRASEIAHAHLNALDREILRHAWRHGAVRRSVLAALTGASGWSVKERAGALRSRGLVARTTEPVVLSDDAGRLVRTTAVLWGVAGRGHHHAGSWIVPGTSQKITATGRAVPIASTLTPALAGAQLDAAYRTWGYAVATRRELERAARMSGQPSPWGTTCGDGQAHVPLLAAIGADGCPWAVDLVLDARERPWGQIAQAHQARGRGLVLHAPPGTDTQVVQVLSSSGLGLVRAREGLWVSGDGLVRVERWMPGRTAERDPGQWGAVPGRAPAALPGTRVDLSGTWRRRRVPVDPADLAAA